MAMAGRGRACCWTQVSVPVTKALEEGLEPLIVLGRCVLALPEPEPQEFPVLIVTTGTDLGEVAVVPVADVLADLQVTGQVQPLGDWGVPEGQVHIEAGLPRPGMIGQEFRKPLRPAGPVQGLGLCAPDNPAASRRRESGPHRRPRRPPRPPTPP